jgi:hypothetical protein
MPTEQTSLYDRLGGVYSIATVVDDFINRIMIDPRLSAPSRAPGRIQVPRDRDGLLGHGWSAEVYGQVDGGIAQGSEDYGQGVGGVPGRF